MFKKIALTAAIAAAMTGCGDRVTVAPGETGKIMTPSGYKEGYIPTSTFRMEACFSVCDKLVTIDETDKVRQERMQLFMPRDKLNMTFDMRLTLAVNPSKRDLIFSKVMPVAAGDGGYEIPIDKAYQIYAQPIIRTATREYMSQFSIAEVASSREKIGGQLAQIIIKELNSKTPFIARYVGLADVQYPDIITKAQERAAERREAIAQEEAQLQIEKVRLERDLTKAQLQRKVDVEKAKAEAAVNKILADSMTAEYKAYRQLEALDKIATSNNTKFVPVEMLSSLAGQVMIGGQK